MEARKQEYVFDNAWEGARKRLGLLEALGDPATVRHLEHLGVGEGWRCLEVGGGGGSVADWLCRRVGRTGSVLATDLDTRFLELLDQPNLEVRRHDIVNEPLPKAAFDLVHARALLTHIPERRSVLERMASSLRADGRLLLEEVDCVSAVPDPGIGSEAAGLFARGQRALDLVLEAGGGDRYYGRRLYGEICATGLVDVESEGVTTMMRGGSPIAALQALTALQARERLIEVGGLHPADADGFIALYADPRFVWMGNIIMSVWGRRESA